MITIELSSATDDFGFYFAWKRSVEENDYLEEVEQKEESARKLSRRLSLRPSTGSDFDFATKKIKFKSNREIELINKWRAVDLADEDLEKVRNSHQRRLESYEGRWRKLEASQLFLKQNLVKFNNFVKEKLLKVEEGEMRTERHNEVFLNKQREVLALIEQLKVLRAGRDRLKVSVEEKQVFSDYLECVLVQREEMFENIDSMMSRCESLIISRDNLQVRYQYNSNLISQQSSSETPG